MSTDQEALDVDTEPAYVRHTFLSTFNKCQRQYELQYVHPVPRTPQGALLGGSAVHEAVEWGEKEDIWLREDGRRLIEEYSLKAFDRRVAEEGGPDKIRWAGRKTKQYPFGEDYKWWAFHARVFSNRWLDIRRNDAINGLKLLPGGAELEFTASIPYEPEDISLRGRVDAFMYYDEDGQALIRDWKTGQRGRSSVIQLATYAWGISASGRGLRITRGEFVYLRGSHIESFDLEPYLELIPEMYSNLETARRSARETGVYLIQPSQLCKACQVKNHCPYGRTLEE